MAKNRVFRLLTWILLGLSILLAVAAILFTVIDPPEPLSTVVVTALILAIPFPIVGVILTWHYPRHLIGWIFSFFGLVQSLGIFTSAYGHYSLLAHPGSLPFGDTVFWVSQWIWMVSLGLIIHLFLLFPDGRPLSIRWRWLGRLASAGIFLIVLFSGAVTWPNRGLPMLCFQAADEANQAALRRLCPPGLFGRTDATFRAILITQIIFISICVLGSVVSLIYRYRRSTGVGRQQIKWFVFSAVLALIDIIILFTPLSNTLWGVIAILTILSLPVAVTVAILRYHLWDIDIIIRRTLLYSVLTATLALIYYTSVLVLQSLFRFLTGDTSPAAIVLSTLMIAALFNQVRMRIRNWIDRRFYRQRYNAEQAVQNFSKYMRDEVDIERLNHHLLDAIQETVQPLDCSLWVRKRG